MYKKPCVGITWSGKAVPPCIGNNNPSGSSSNTNTNNNTNNITINVTAENRVASEKPDKK